MSEKEQIPRLLITPTGGNQLGNCYYSSSHRIVSTHQLNNEFINSLRDQGFFGIGQEFFIGKEKTENEADLFPPDKFHSSDKRKVYVYNTQTRVDSSG